MEQNVFVIGGGEIYSLFLPHIEKIYRTIIHCNVEQPDTFAPEIDENVSSYRNQICRKIRQRSI